MQTVYADEDCGVLAPWSRWKPRRVRCTVQPDHSDRPGEEHVVKFRQSPLAASQLSSEAIQAHQKTSVAALISEVLGNWLLAAGGLHVLDARLVSVTARYASDHESRSDKMYMVPEGLHFGTLRRFDVENGGPSLTPDYLMELQQVVDLWAFDSWLCNIDRDLLGNTLLALASGGRFNLIAADQSDCFGGSGLFSDGTWQKVLEKSGAAPSFGFLPQAIFSSGGSSSIRQALEKVGRAVAQMDSAFTVVPADWWAEAQIDPHAVQQALTARHERLPSILGLDHWEGLERAIQGGQPL